MSNSVRPHRLQPTRLPGPWDSPGKNTGVGCHFLLQCMKVKVKSLSCVWLLATPWTPAYQAPPSMGFSRQEYWSGSPLHSPHPYMTTGKTIALTRRTFVGKVMPLLFKMLSMLIIAFLPRSKHLLISWLQSPFAVILEPPKILSYSLHCFPIYLSWSDGTRCHDLSFLNV